MLQQPIEGIAGTTSGLHRAVRAIVEDALTRGVGETLSTNGDFRERLGVGAGTLQRALDLLADRDALRTTSRGHLGRRIDAIGLGDCWQAAGLSPVRFLLSPAGPVELDVLESALGDELTALGVPYTVHHSRGGNGRLRGVSQGDYDVAVVSAGTLDGARRSLALQGLGEARVLGAGTYYAPDRLVILRGPAAADPVGRHRVAIDRESFDHEALTLAEFPAAEGYEYVQMDFTEVPARVLAGLVGSGVWHITASAVPLFLTGLTADQMATPEGRRVRDSLSAAAAVASAGRPELKAVLDALDLAGLEQRQRARIDAENGSVAALAAESRRHAAGV
ncbi:YhfZ family protein [Propionicicella superfundia]|uniref:YhfZ family protein n=1 Tax=Propionicicella superfundia TaxID=348582 RepID=UPI0003F8275A|nr:YhfZ family protein [Propionicicella superfundia]